MSELKDFLAGVQAIASRAGDFRANEASDPKAFSEQLVADLRVLAEAVAALIVRAGE